MNETTPLISIITVTRNAACTVGRTAESVRVQDFTDYEHIIIDGASRDNTIGVARSCGVEGLRIVSEPDRGLYDAMNKGLALARGEYVIFLNAGDKFHSDTTLGDYGAFAREGYDIIYGDTVIVDDFGTCLGKRHHSAPERLDADSFKRGMLVCHQAFMVRRCLAPQYDTSYRYSADYDWCVKCLKRTRADRCARLGVTIDYLNEGITTGNRMASLRERYRIMAEHYGSFPTLLRHIGFVPRLLWRKVRGV